MLKRVYYDFGQHNKLSFIFKQKSIEYILLYSNPR